MAHRVALVPLLFINLRQMQVGFDQIRFALQRPGEGGRGAIHVVQLAMQHSEIEMQLRVAGFQYRRRVDGAARRRRRR